VLTSLAAQPRIGAAGPVGVGPLVTTLAQVGAAFAEADQVAEAAIWLGLTQPLARLADLRLAGLVYQLRHDARVLAFAERELGPLLRHDASAGADLTGLLAAYLQSGGRKAQTAKWLGLARPTLYQRLRQVEQVLGVSLDRAEVRLALHAALLTLRSAGA